ncbi:MAG: hypothetical protein R2849_14115 [Thermomicrobiales bacterium]
MQKTTVRAIGSDIEETGCVTPADEPEPIHLSSGIHQLDDREGSPDAWSRAMTGSTG